MQHGDRLVSDWPYASLGIAAVAAVAAIIIFAVHSCNETQRACIEAGGEWSHSACVDVPERDTETGHE